MSPHPPNIVFLGNGRNTQKNPRVRKILVRGSEVWKWVRQIYGRLEFLLSFCKKTSMSIKFLVLGGVFGFFLGGEWLIMFLWGGDFSEILSREYNFVRGNTLSSAQNSVSSLWHTNMRLRGTYWALSPELGEGQKTHWARCSKLYSPKPYSACLRLMWRSASAKKGRYRKSLVAPCGWEFNRGRGRNWESRSLSRFCFALVGFRHYGTTIARLSPLSGLERGGWGLPPAFGCEIGRDRGLPIALPIAERVL